MKKHALILLLLMLSLPGFAQNARFEWFKKIGDSGDDCPGQITNDSLGNLYVTGSFIGQLIFGTDTLQSTNATDASIFLAKYDSTGQVQWGRKLPLTYTGTNGCGPITLSKLRISPKGRIYLIGSINYNGTTREYISISRSDGSLVGFSNSTPDHNNLDIDFDSVDNAYVIGVNATTINSSFIIKFDSLGTVKWSYNYNQENVFSNVKYANGRVHIFGQFHYQMLLADTIAGSSPVTLTASGGINDWDFLIATYSSKGKLLAASQNAGLTGTGPFFLSSDFTPSIKWRMSFVDASLKANTKSYSPNTFGTLDSATITAVACLFKPGTHLKSSQFKDEVAFSYSDIICPPGNVYVLDSVGKVSSTFVVPFAAPSRGIAQPDYSFDRNSHLFVTTNFLGNIKYTDTAGTHTISSSFGSQDIYVAKYHACPVYNPQITQSHDTLYCSDSGLKFQWYVGNIAVPFANSQYLIPTESGNVKVVVSDAWGCTDTSATYVFTITVGINGVGSNHSFTIQPNPAHSEITVSGIPLRSIIQITDVLGKIVVSTISTSDRTRIDISSLYQGVYFIRTHFGRYTFVRL